jgi:hypothetical protein
VTFPRGRVEPDAPARRAEGAAAHAPPAAGEPLPAPGRRRRGGALRLGAGVVAVAVLAVAALALTGHGPARVGRAAPVDPAQLSLGEFFGGGLTAQSRGSFGLERMQIQPEPDADLGPVLRVTFPAGSASQTAARSHDAPEGGAQVFLWLDAPVEELRLRYSVRFPQGFDFVRGGKLPGLFGGTVTDGREIPDGTDGFSTRYMWRARGAGEVYTYLPSSEEHGTSLGRGTWTFPTGRWVAVEQEVRLNRPGRSDGSITVWVDGTEVFRQDRVVFRTVEQLQVDGVFFSTFFGGGDLSWATPRDQYVDFAGFEISSS